MMISQLIDDLGILRRLPTPSKEQKKIAREITAALKEHHLKTSEVEIAGESHRASFRYKDGKLLLFITNYLTPKTVSGEPPRVSRVELLETQVAQLTERLNALEDRLNDSPQT